VLSGEAEVGVADSAEAGDAAGAFEACDENLVSEEGDFVQHGCVGGTILCGFSDGGTRWHGVRYHGRENGHVEPFDASDG
jgi:hypothetical protein